MEKNYVGGQNYVPVFCVCFLQPVFLAKLHVLGISPFSIKGVPTFWQTLQLSAE
jgi:hypothetical protein